MYAIVKNWRQAEPEYRLCYVATVEKAARRSRRGKFSHCPPTSTARR